MRFLGSQRDRPAFPPWPVLLCLFTVAQATLEADVIVEESYNLSPGWNAIQLPVEPTVRDPQTALSAIDWDSLWTWLPVEGEPRGGRWLVAYRAHPAFLNTLVNLAGPGQYLLLTRSGGVLRIQGAVSSRRQALKGGVFQLFGPSFSRSSPPTFAGYFSRLGVREHVGSAFELAGQAYRRLASSDPLRPGAAYWLFPDQDIPAPDPLRLGAGIGGFQFDEQTTVGELVVDIGDANGNGAGGGIQARQLNLSARAVVPPGDSGTTDWLEFQRPDGTFAPLGAGVLIDVAPEQTSIRVAFSAARPNTSSSSAADQQAVIELSAPEGNVVIAAELDVPNLKGVWIGDASITEVERPSFHGGGFAPAPEMGISLILEIPSAGPARLLPCLSVASTRDGRKVSYRLEAALFHESTALAGSVAQDGTSGTLTGSMALPPDHPLNPFRHRYNPEHIQGLDVFRKLKLSFGAQGAEPIPENPLAQVGVLGGVYEEEISGFTREPIRIRGAFRLRRLASDAATACSEAAR
jgi:hypothetical protein